MINPTYSLYSMWYILLHNNNLNFYLVIYESIKRVFLQNVSPIFILWETPGAKLEYPIRTWQHSVD